MRYGGREVYAGGVGPTWAKAFFGNSNGSNTTDDFAIGLDQTNLNVGKFHIGFSGVQRSAYQSQPSGGNARAVGIDFWSFAGPNPTSQTPLAYDEHNCASFQVSPYADNGKAGSTLVLRILKLRAIIKALVGSGTHAVTSAWGAEIESVIGAAATNAAALLIAPQNFIKSRDNSTPTVDSSVRALLGIDSGNNAIFGDANIASLLSGSVVVMGPSMASARETVAYNATPTPNALLGNIKTLTITNATPFQIQNPTSLVAGVWFLLLLRNTSGGAHGGITFGTAWKVDPTAIAIATGKSLGILCHYDGTNVVEWVRGNGLVVN